METDTLEVEWVATEKLFCSPANPRHNDEAVPHVAASIVRFGWRQPIVAKPSGEVLAGNTRLKAALARAKNDPVLAAAVARRLDDLPRDGRPVEPKELARSFVGEQFDAFRKNVAAVRHQSKRARTYNTALLLGKKVTAHELIAVGLSAKEAS